MSSKIKLIVLMLVASLCVAACSRDKEQAKQAAPAKPAETIKVQTLPPPPEFLQVTGKVLEILDTGGFIYVSLDWNGKQVWAALPAVDLKVGEVISLDQATMIEKSFQSNALNRTFDKIIFASSVAGKVARSRVANSSNPKSPKNLRSGKLVAVPSPAPPRPTGKVAGKV